MRTNPKASTPSPDSAIAAAVAASAAPEATASISSKTLLQLLQEPPLVAIALNFDPLKKAAERLKLPDHQLAQYHKTLAEIADHVTEINKTIEYENTEHSLSTVAAAGKTDSLYMTTIADRLEKLRESIRQLDNLASLKNRPLITAIKHRIERSFALLNREVRKRLHSDAIGRQEVPWQMHAFHSEQSLIAQDADQQAVLDTLLSDLSKIFTFDGKPPQCFMSYAWPTTAHRFQESWVPLFLKTLRAHLRSAGIHALLDIEDNIGAGHSEDFSQGAKACEYGLVFCTPSLKDRLDALNYSSVQLELNLIKEKREQDRTVYNQSRIIYMLGAGHEHESLPEEWVDRELIFNWREKSYAQSLQALLSSFYATHYPEASEDYKAQWLAFKSKWDAFYAAHPDRTKALTLEQVQAQLSNPTYASRIAALDSEILKEQQYEALQAYYQQQREDADALFSTPLYQLPQRNLNFTGRVSQLDQIARQLESNPVGVITQSVGGLGGVGKSSLVLEHAHTARVGLSADTERGGAAAAAAAAAGGERVAYDYIVWLSAREPLTAFSSFAQDVLDLDPQVYKNDHAMLMRQIYICLSQAYPNVLLVLDDVSNKDKVAPFLPKERYGDGKLHILLTSRSAHWTGHAVIELDVFDPADARAYILKLLNPEGQAPTETPESADELAKSLSYFPLALSQAVAYIQQTGCGIAGYLTRYVATHDNKAKLLQVPSEQTPEALAQNAHQKMVYTTWYLSIESLRATLPEAEQLLNVCAYYAPDPIPNRVINRAFTKDDFEFNKILRGLRDYSLIAVEEQESIQLHQLLQEVLRQHHRFIKGSLSKKNYALKALMMIENVFTYGEFETDNYCYAVWEYNKPLLKHIETITESCDEIVDLRLLSSTLLNNAGMLYLDLGNAKKSRIFIKRSLRINQTLFSENDSIIGRNYNNLGKTYAALGNYDKQINFQEKSLKIQIKNYGHDHCFVAAIMNNLANAYGALGDNSKKLALLEKAMIIMEKEFGPNHFEVAGIKSNIGILYNSLRRYRDSSLLLREALVVFEEHFGTDHVEVARVLNNLGDALGFMNKFSEQKKLTKRALKIKEKLYGIDHIETAKNLNSLGNAYRGLKKYRQQIKVQEKALEIQRRSYTTQPIEIAITYYNLAIAYLLVNEIWNALNYAQFSLDIFQKSYQDQEHQDIKESKKLVLHCESKKTQLIMQNIRKLMTRYRLTDNSQSSLEKALRNSVVNRFHTDLKFLLQQVKNINAQDSNPASQKTALHWAVIKGNKEAISLLLKADARYDIPDASGKTALDYANDIRDPGLMGLFIDDQAQHEPSLKHTPVPTQAFFDYLEKNKMLPQDMPYQHFETHFVSHAQRAEFQEAYHAFMAEQMSSATLAGTNSLATAASVHTNDPVAAVLAQSSTAAVTASSATAGIFAASQQVSPLVKLLFQTKKQIPEPGQVQLIFKTQTEAEDCQRQLQAATQSASAPASAAASPTDYAIESTRIIDEDKAGTSAASTAAAVKDSYAIIIFKDEYNQILQDTRAYDDLLESMAVMSRHTL